MPTACRVGLGGWWATPRGLHFSIRIDSVSMGSVGKALRRAAFWRVLWALILGNLSQSTKAGVVEDWNEEMIQAFRSEVTAPCLGARHLAILHAAMHDTVNACAPRFAMYRPTPAECRPSAESADRLRDPAQVALAAAAAAHEVAQALAPARKAEFDRLLTQHLGVSSADSVQREAILFGRGIASRLLRERADDGASTTTHYVPDPELGQWRRTDPTFRPPEAPHWGGVRPFVLGKASQFRPPPVPAPTSMEFMALRSELQRLGGRDSVERTAEQTLIARFWSDFSYTSTPPGHWNEILRSLSIREGLDLHSSARAFFLVNLAMADAGIAVWDAKYFYNTWRPITAIHQSQGTKDWQPLLNTPPHPEYPSGHSGFSGAAAGVLMAIFPNRPPGWSFSVSSDTVKDATRTFTSFEECALECSMSRIYGGIHFRPACEQGLILGYKIAHEVLRQNE